jgi:hypothetical protein
LLITILNANPTLSNPRAAVLFFSSVSSPSRMPPTTSSKSKKASKKSPAPILDPATAALCSVPWSIIKMSDVNESLDIFCERGGRSNRMGGNAMFRALSKSLTPSLRIAQQSCVRSPILFSFISFSKFS